jgi:hypothetical protein
VGWLVALTAMAGPAPAGAPATDEPLALWAPAHSGNFQAADRPRERAIDTVVIHDIEGPGESAVRWFQNPMARASAHYVLGADGKLWQQVRERDIAWHAGNRDTNARSVGIEHAGYAYRPGFYNHAQYTASARLVRAITQRHGIPRDRTRIIAHSEVPHPDDPTRFGGRSGHTDPGPYWDWAYFMALVRNDARLESFSYRPVIRPGEEAPLTAVFSNAGDDPWPIFNSGRRDPVQQARGPVYLGLSAERPAPLPVESPLYQWRKWVSPRYLAAPTEPEPQPGQLAVFNAVLRGPRQLGPLTEELRLWKVPTAPGVPVPFGPSLTLRLRVEPWRLLFPVAAPGFAGADWRLRPGVAWRPAGARGAAAWKARLPTDGNWDLWVRHHPGPGRVPKVLYTVSTREGAVRHSARVPAAGGWVRLPRVGVPGPTADVTVTIDGLPGARGSIAVTGLRCTGPYPAPRP